MDNFLLQAVVAELAPFLIGRHLGKVYQIGDTDLIVDFRLPGGLWLTISTDSTRLAVYLAKRPESAPGQTLGELPAFSARVRKVLGSSRLTRIEKLGYDRIVELEFETGSDADKAATLRLVISLAGRSADVYLLEGETILASLRNWETDNPMYRLPSPPADRVDPYFLPEPVWLNLISSVNGRIEDAALRLLGFTPIYARELAFLAQRSDPFVALQGLLASLSTTEFAPNIYSKAPLDQLNREPGAQDSELVLSHINLNHLEGYQVTQFPTISEAADRYFTLLRERRRFNDDRQRLLSHLRAQSKKQSSLLEKLKRELTKFESAETFQRFGDLLLANLHQAVKSDQQFQVIDYFDAECPVVQIPNADLSDPRDAAARYFKLAKKSRKGLKAIGERLPMIESDLRRLVDLLEKAASVTHQQELDDLLTSVKLGKSAKAPGTQSTKEKEPGGHISGLRRYRSSDGYEILIGRTDRDNDKLTMRIAKSSDFWFHAADYPGSHVVLRNPQRKPVSPTSIREAAQLAAKFSQAKEDAKVAVNYCERKFVSKPKGFQPGQVRLASFKTILVEPKEAGERLL